MLRLRHNVMSHLNGSGVRDPLPILNIVSTPREGRCR